MTSSQPRKQRKSQYNAPPHIKRKRMRARLILDKGDSRFATVRSVTVRVGDEVEVIRGDFGHPSKGKRNNGPRGRAGLRGTVLAVLPETGHIHISEATTQKSDGKEVAYPIHVSNVVVKRLDESDAKRLAKLQERTKGE